MRACGCVRAWAAHVHACVYARMSVRLRDSVRASVRVLYGFVVCVCAWGRVFVCVCAYVHAHVYAYTCVCAYVSARV